MAKQIGIVGAAGDVGQDLAKYLLTITDCNLLLGDIQKETVSEIASSLGDRVDSALVDVYDADVLNAFCDKCDLIVSTTGPSKYVVDKVALPSLKKGINYMDIGGSSDLYDALTDKDTEIKEKGLSYLVSAGMSPGFTGTLPMYLTSTDFFDRIESFTMNLAFAGGALSYTGCHDMLSGFGKRKESAVWKNNGWLPSQPEMINLPEPIGKAMGSPVVEAEIRKYIEKLNPGFYSMHMSILDELVGMTLGFIYSQGLYNETHIKASAQFLSGIFGYSARNSEATGLLFAQTTGVKDGQTRTIKTDIRMTPDLNLTAACAAVYAKMLIDDSIPEKGRFWAGEITNPKIYVPILESLGVKLVNQES